MTARTRLFRIGRAEASNPLLRDVPTAIEGGLLDYVVTSGNGLASRAGLPDSTLTKLDRLVVTALQDSTLRERALGLGIDPRGSTPEQIRERMAQDIVKWRSVIEKANISTQ